MRQSITRLARESVEDRLIPGQSPAEAGYGKQGLAVLMNAQEILTELPHLSAEDQELIAQALQDLKDVRTNPSSNPDGLRVANLHPGAMVVAPDFDDPLPDEFWFGKDT